MTIAKSRHFPPLKKKKKKKEIYCWHPLFGLITAYLSPLCGPAVVKQGRNHGFIALCGVSHIKGWRFDPMTI